MKFGDLYKQSLSKEFNFSTLKKTIRSKKNNTERLRIRRTWENHIHNRKIFYHFKYWFKIFAIDENKYIKMAYKLILSDLDRFPNKVNWASLVRNLLMSLGFIMFGWIRGWRFMMGS